MDTAMPIVVPADPKDFLMGDILVSYRGRHLASSLVISTTDHSMVVAESFQGPSTIDFSGMPPGGSLGMMIARAPGAHADNDVAARERLASTTIVRAMGLLRAEVRRHLSAQDIDAASASLRRVYGHMAAALGGPYSWHERRIIAEADVTEQGKEYAKECGSDAELSNALINYTDNVWPTMRDFIDKAVV